MSDHGWGWGWHNSSEAPWAPWQIKAWQNAGGLADEAHGTPGRHQWWYAPREEPSGPAEAAEPSAAAEPAELSKQELAELLERLQATDL